MNVTNYEAEAAAFYPTGQEVDTWAQTLVAEAEQTPVRGEFLDTMPVTTSFGNNPNTLVNRYVRFTRADGSMFYGYWQPAFGGRAPLLINLPGYGGSISNHPQLCDLGYHILHISPLGYVTPDGENTALQENGSWPVLSNTARGVPGGYRDWLCDCLRAIHWALCQPQVQGDSLSLFGTSQGGGGSLLLASLLGQKINCVCADLPFLTNFPLAAMRGSAYGLLQPVYAQISPDVFWRNLGMIDTLSHVHRLHIPVLLTAGGKDDVCPPETVKSLFDRLGDIVKQYTFLRDEIHTHTRESMFLFTTWLRMYGIK